MIYHNILNKDITDGFFRWEYHNPNKTKPMNGQIAHVCSNVFKGACNPKNLQAAGGAILLGAGWVAGTLIVPAAKKVAAKIPGAIRGVRAKAQAAKVIATTFVIPAVKAKAAAAAATATSPFRKEDKEE